MIFVVPSDTKYRSFPLVGGPISGKQVLVPCDGLAKTCGLQPLENFRSLNLSVRVAASVPGPYQVDEGGANSELAHYVYAAEANSYVAVDTNVRPSLIISNTGAFEKI